MKHLRVTAQAQPQVFRLLERRGALHTSARSGQVVPVGHNVLYTHHHLPVIQPDPLPRELIAAEFTPGR